MQLLLWLVLLVMKTECKHAQANTTRLCVLLQLLFVMPVLPPTHTKTNVPAVCCTTTLQQQQQSSLYSHMAAGEGLGFAGGRHLGGVLAHPLQEQLERASCGRREVRHAEREEEEEEDLVVWLLTQHKQQHQQLLLLRTPTYHHGGRLCNLADLLICLHYLLDACSQGVSLAPHLLCVVVWVSVWGDRQGCCFLRTAERQHSKCRSQSAVFRKTTNGWWWSCTRHKLSLTHTSPTHVKPFWPCRGFVLQ